MVHYKKLQRHYQDIENQGKASIIHKNEFIDDKLHYISADHRFGMSLVISFDEEIKNVVKNIHQKLQTIDPYQYYYPLSDIHLTILTVSQMQEHFIPSRDQINRLDQVFQETILPFRSFKIYFKGITISNGAVIMKGFYDHYLHLLRENIQNGLIKEGFPICSAHSINTAHSTIVRFNNKLRHRNDYINKVSSLSDHYIGGHYIKNIEFVYHNWYNTSNRKVEIKRYSLLSK